MSALSKNGFPIENLSLSDDTRILQSNLEFAGQKKDAGHAGTAMRFLTAYLSIRSGTHILTGTHRMKQRPIGELVTRLTQMGAEIRYLEKEGYPPLQIRGRRLEGGRISVNAGISSQYISALMMIGPVLEKGLEIILEGEILSSSYIDLSLDLMKMKGIDTSRNGNRIRISPGEYNEERVRVEPDWSSASYWFALTGLYPGSRVLLHGLSEKDLQGDRALVRIFSGLGVECLFTDEGLIIRSDDLKKQDLHLNFSDNPDLVQTLAPYCVAKKIPFHFEGCRSLRIKETDRVEALARELAKVGVVLGYSDSGDEIWWKGKIRETGKPDVSIKTYKDHRMAMGMFPLVRLYPGLQIQDPGVVSKSYPDFWKDLAKAGFGIEETDITP